MFTEELSSMYDEMFGPPGIPWAGLTANGHGIDVDGYDGAYMEYMLKAGADFFAVIGKLNDTFLDKYKTLRADEGRTAITRISAVIEQAGADVWQAVKEGNWFATLAVPRTTTIDALATIAAASANGAYLHYDGVMESAVRAGKLKPEEVMQHAQSVTKVFQTFVDLEKNGHLEDFKKNPPVSGLGVAPLVIWAIAVLGVAVVLGICYLVNVFMVAAPAQQKAIAWCDQLAKSGNKDDIMTCVNAAENMQKNGNENLASVFKGALTPIVVVLAVGTALYMAPYVLKGFAGLRTARAG
jgi:hypothetical protein